MKDLSYEVVKLKATDNAYELIEQYCKSNGYTITGEELKKWIEKIISIGDPLGIIYNNEIIAFLLLYCNKYDTLEAYICNVYVRKDFRGKQLSKLLVEEAIQICKNREFRIINLDVAQSNIPAIKVYTRSGFEKTNSYLKDSEPYYKMTYKI